MPPDSASRYAFRPLREDDLSLIASWLAAEHVAAWWDPPAIAVPKIAAHLAGGTIRAYLVSIDGRPAAYLQAYDPLLEADHPYRDQPRGTLGIDQFIGEADLVGKGHGPGLLDHFVRARFDEGVPRIISDPHPDNRRALRAYAKAGFRPLDRRTTIYGTALIMGRDAGEPTRPR
ncbi:MAG: acetyltransferase [Bosea sp.]|nr:acetyltransferase [Bosea sp. (in: a-proteobacteria)]